MTRDDSSSHGMGWYGPKSLICASVSGWPHADAPPSRHPHEARLCCEYSCSPQGPGGLSRVTTRHHSSTGTVCAVAWWLPACQGGGGMVVPAGKSRHHHSRSGPVQLRAQAPCATALPKLPCSASHSLWAVGFQCVGSPSCLLALWSSWQTFPFFGVVPAILNESGEELEGEAEGYLVTKG